MQEVETGFEVVAEKCDFCERNISYFQKKLNKLPWRNCIILFFTTTQTVYISVPRGDLLLLFIFPPFPKKGFNFEIEKKHKSSLLGQDKHKNFPSGLHRLCCCFFFRGYAWNSFFISLFQIEVKGKKETHTREKWKKSTQHDLNKRFLPSTNWDSITCTAITKNFSFSSFEFI